MITACLEQNLNNKEHMHIKVIPYLEVKRQHWVLVFQQPYVVNGEQKQCCFFSLLFFFNSGLMSVIFFFF